MIRLLRRFRSDQEGATSVEYAMIALVVAMATFAAYQNLGSKVESVTDTVVDAMTGS